MAAWLTSPTNSRGYTAEGWKPPTLAERVQAVEQIANLLIEPDRPSSLRPPA